MKKSFLIAGLIAGIAATNSYADIVISQTDDSPDTVITVARAGKIGTRVTPKESDINQAVATVLPQNTTSSGNGAEMAVKYVCPEGCMASLHGRQLDGVENNIFVEYTKCVYIDNNKNCGVPTAEIVGAIINGSTINSGKRQREWNPSAVDIAEQEWLAGGGYYDENGNPVNPNKKKR